MDRTEELKHWVDLFGNIGRRTPDLKIYALGRDKQPKTRLSFSSHTHTNRISNEHSNRDLVAILT
jgi:hypothetical protein